MEKLGPKIEFKEKSFADLINGTTSYLMPISSANCFCSLNLEPITSLKICTSSSSGFCRARPITGEPLGDEA